MSMPINTTGTAVVVVIGDIARSPRIMYHCVELSENGFLVDLVGIQDTELPRQLTKRAASIRVHGLADIIKSRPAWAPYLPFAMLRAVVLAIHLVYLLLRLTVRGAPLLVQTPPAIPMLVVARLVCLLKPGVRLIIDWHNLGYTLLALKTGKSSLITRIAKRIEMSFGRSAYCHFFVSEAMKRRLSVEWSLGGKLVTFPDSPQKHFCRINDPSEKHKIIYNELVPHFPELEAQQFAFGRDLLIVSSTSWTPDEDFTILLTALELLAAEQQQLHNGAGGGSGGRIFFLVTGKGALRSTYERRFRSLSGEQVIIRTEWVPYELYSRTLGVADLGVCLHTSSSGIDLPMKVVDMFGCGVPVLALKFECIEELVQPGKTGMLFSDGRELYDQIKMLYTNRTQLAHLAAGVASQHSAERRWPQAWRRTALPVMMSGRSDSDNSKDVGREF